MKDELNVLTEEKLTQAQVEQDITRMMQDVRKHLKPNSKNQLIQMIQQLLFEMHYLKMELQTLKSTKKDDKNA